MRVVVTGATGFIGANLVRHLVARGDEVHCIIRKPNQLLEGLDLSLHTVPLNDSPEDVDALAEVLQGCEGIYHVAGIFDPSPGGRERMHQVHVAGTRALLKAGEKAGVARMVLCSSSVTVGFGPRHNPGNEHTAFDAAAVYGASGALRDYHDTKLESEQLGASWPTVEVVTVNPDFIIGALDVKPTSGQLIVTMAKQWVPFFPQGGKCFQDADDCALGHILAMERGKAGQRYLLGNQNLSYREFMELVAEVVGARAPKIPLPTTALWAAGQIGRIGSRFDAHRFAGLNPYVLRSMQQERYRSGARARDELGVPQTDMKVAVKKAYKWFRDHGYC